MKPEHVTLPIYNLGCAGGGALTIERVLTRAPGVVQAYVNPATEMAYIRYIPALSSPGQLATAIERAGFGPRINKAEVETLTVTKKPDKLDARRFMLVGGLWLAGIYAISIALDLLFPNQFQIHHLWNRILISFDWPSPWTIVLGLVEAFLYGALGVWAFTNVYNATIVRRSK